MCYRVGWVLAFLALFLHAFSLPEAQAQHTHSHEGEEPHHSQLHFTHPLVTESPSPDTKLRLNHFFRNLDDEGVDFTSNTTSLDAEYAFHPSVSIEAKVPFVVRNPEIGDTDSRIGNAEVALKFANFAFEEQGLSLGYGLEMGLPTGDEEDGIGSDHIIEYEPFFNVAYKQGPFEAVAFGSYGIPTNQNEGDEIETEFGYNLSLLFHVSPRVQGLVELDGETALSGEEDEVVANFTPGLRVRPLASRPLVVGVGASFPATDDRGFDVRSVFSLFYHF